MFEGLSDRLRALRRRAGLGRVPAPVVVAAAMLVAVAVGVGIWWAWPHGDSAVAFDSSGAGAGAPTAVTSPIAAAVVASAQPDVVVQVVGAVHRPGVYRLHPGARVEEAVDAAGGLLGDAPPAGVNLARAVVDGEQIVVPTRAEWEKGGGAAGVAGAGALAAGGAPSGGGFRPVDINSANAAQLDALPGVGPATAARIVADRTANGRFASTDDLGRVPGIGPKKLDALKGLIVAR